MSTIVNTTTISSFKPILSTPFPPPILGRVFPTSKPPPYHSIHPASSSPQKHNHRAHFDFSVNASARWQLQGTFRHDMRCHEHTLFSNGKELLFATSIRGRINYDIPDVGVSSTISRIPSGSAVLLESIRVSWTSFRIIYQWKHLWR